MSDALLPQPLSAQGEKTMTALMGAAWPWGCYSYHYHHTRIIIIAGHTRHTTPLTQNWRTLTDDGDPGDDDHCAIFRNRFWFKA
jgi:hypothetical protein